MNYVFEGVLTEFEAVWVGSRIVYGCLGMLFTFIGVIKTEIYRFTGGYNGGT